MLGKLYTQHVCPHIINFAMQNKVISKQREKIIPSARGRVLEIGIGSGLNFSLYDKSKINDVFAVEPDNILLEKAKKRALDNNININVALANKSPIGVDSKEDYLAIKKIMKYK